jgi:hypothetical protein
MSAASLFRDFRSNLAVSNSEDISQKYASITTRLNADFWNLESDTQHRLQIGSYGRGTAIDGISDLDMVFELPPKDLERFKRYNGNGPSAMLQEVRNSLLKRYPKTTIKADGPVVGIFFDNYHVEILPGFRDADGNYIYGDTNDGGSWRLTKPRPEIEAVNVMDKTSNGNLRHAAKMLRAWKNKAGVGIGGLLLDTLVYNFFRQDSRFNDATYASYPQLLLSLFTYMAGLPEAQESWAAPGSAQRVKCKAKFQRKAAKAAKRCQDAIDEDQDAASAKHWRYIFGRQFPKPEVVRKVVAVSAHDDEQFIEDRYPVDVRYDIDLDCEIREHNVLRDLLSRVRRDRRKIPLGRSLRFYVAKCDVPGNYSLEWKVRNEGGEAVRRDQLRGEISSDSGHREKVEKSSFSGDHYVEIYAIKDGVVVARDRISVPI